MKFQDVEYLSFSDSFVILRHDVDFSICGALEIARIENNEGISSTYFIHLRSPFYNILYQKYSNIVKEINLLGHDIALHVDLNFYNDDFLNGLKNEIDLLSTFFPFANTKIVSIHRPGNIEIVKRQRLPEIMHTYEKRFVEEIAYISDSDGIWRYGYPTNSMAFQSGKPIQLLTHPLWWTEKGNTPLEKIENYLYGNRDQTIGFFQETLIFNIDF